jgi:deazaflavin-dependent oxidoreductase (nitroreductase family)
MNGTTTGTCWSGDGFRRLEQAFFRRLNAVVEPLLRRGVGSSSITPASLILLETTGFRSGLTRSTPVWSLRLGPYRLVSTARGTRSFWIKNLQQRPEARVVVGGRSESADAIVVAPGFDNTQEWELAPPLRRLVRFLQGRTRDGWAFALLVPQGQ